jgi:hypothetical protein
MASAAAMSDARSLQDSRSPAATGRAAPALTGEAKLALSLWLLYHCIGILITPAAESPLLEAVYRRLYSPYLEPLYMIHRYRFFAPEPGPGSLIRWTVERDDGTKVTGEFPNRGIRPRLLYHRYFMLSERSVPFDPYEEQDVEAEATTGDGSPPSEGLTKAKESDAEAAATTGEGATTSVIVDSGWFEGYARHLIRLHDGATITLQRVIHALPSAEEIQQGRRLEDPRYYNVSEIGHWTRNELEAPDGPATN